MSGLDFPEATESATESPPQGRVIDTSMSFFGWSGISRYAYCPLLAGWTTAQPPEADYRPGLDVEHLNGRDWGTLGHIGMAAQFARWGARKGRLRVGDDFIDDPDMIMPRKPAIHTAVANRHWKPAVAENVVTFVEAYFGKTMSPPGKVVGVEILYVSFLGRVKGELDLWVVREPAEGWPATRQGLLDYEGELITLDGRVVEPERCRLPARVDGKRGSYEDRLIPMTRRFDLLYSPRAGECALWDHKCSVFGWKSGKSERGYAMDGQFCAARKFLKQLAGPEFGMRPGEVRLNYVNRVKPFISGGCALPEVRLDGRFTEYYADLWHRRAADDRDSHWSRWLPRGLESQCRSVYGDCDAYSYCHTPSSTGLTA